MVCYYLLLLLLRWFELIFAIVAVMSFRFVDFKSFYLFSCSFKIQDLVGCFSKTFSTDLVFYACVLHWIYSFQIYSISYIVRLLEIRSYCGSLFQICSPAWIFKNEIYLVLLLASRVKSSGIMQKSWTYKHWSF